MRDYFNAKVAYHDSPDEPVEIIIKVGAVDPVDDMYVDEYVSARADLETIKKEGHPDFALIDYWKNPAPTIDQIDEPVLEPARTMIASDIEDWMTSSGDYADNLANTTIEESYFNAIVEYRDKSNIQVELIIKIGEVHPSDKMYVDYYVKDQIEFEELIKNGHGEFDVIYYSNEPKPCNDTPENNENEANSSFEI